MVAAMAAVMVASRGPEHYAIEAPKSNPST